MNLNKSKILILSLLFTRSCDVVFSQVDTLSKPDSCLNNIVKTKVFRKGFYRNMNEFKTNSPSFTPNFSTYKYDKSAEYFLKVKGVDLILTDRTEKRINIGDPVWGFCDGAKVYYVDDNAVSEILLFGHYCIYRKAQFGADLNYNPWSMNNEYKTPPDYVLNILTGKTMIISVKNLKNIILADDPDLLEQFNKENIPKSVLFLYVKKYNERHPVTF